MKYLSTLLIIFLFLTFMACEKKSTDPDNVGKMETVQRTEDDPVQKVLDANKLKRLVTIKNPNTMELETTPIDTATIKAEKKVIEQLAEKFLNYAAKNGIDAALEEVNKSKNGIFKDDLVGAFFYLPILKRIDETKFVIVAHATSKDFIGVELDPNMWQDLTGWKYFIEPIEKGKSGETNCIWVEGVYWKDPNWIDGKPVQFSSYERFYKIDNEEYLYHYCLFLHE